VCLEGFSPGAIFKNWNGESGSGESRTGGNRGKGEYGGTGNMGDEGIYRGIFANFEERRNIEIYLGVFLNRNFHFTIMEWKAFHFTVSRAVCNTNLGLIPHFLLDHIQ
jgi:hypothetical protein